MNQRDTEDKEKQMSDESPNPYASPQSQINLDSTAGSGDLRERPLELKVGLAAIGFAVTLMAVEDLRTSFVVRPFLIEFLLHDAMEYAIAAVGIAGLLRRYRWAYRLSLPFTLLFVVVSAENLRLYLAWVQTNRVSLDMANSYSILQFGWGNVAYAVARQVLFCGCMVLAFAMLLRAPTRRYFAARSAHPVGQRTAKPTTDADENRQPFSAASCGGTIRAP